MTKFMWNVIPFEMKVTKAYCHELGHVDPASERNVLNVLRSHFAQTFPSIRVLEFATTKKKRN